MTMPAMGGPETFLRRVETEIAREFRVLRVLGEGAVAHVFLARELALERLVALKVMRPKVAESEVARRRFGREGRAAARIAHRNVATVHRVGELSDGTPYLVMEYIEGRTLTDLLAAEGPLPPGRVADVLRQVASALAAAHGHGIIHRDVRPGNILVENGSGRVVLTDFGLAGLAESAVQAEARLTRTGEILGEARYASPEQLRAEPVTPTTDIYSLAVVGYELLTGQGPFGDRRPAEYVAAHLKETPRPLRSLRPDAGEALSQVLERSLDKHPARRPLPAQVVEALTPGAGAAPPSAQTAARPVPTEPRSALGSFLSELKRRRVYRAAVTYIAGAFLTLEGADLVLPALPGAPSWIFPALVLTALGGLPVVLILAWVYDIGAGGLRRTPGTGAPPGGRWLRLFLQLLGLLASLAVAYLLGRWLLR